MSLSEILASLPPELGLSEQANGSNGICEIIIDGQLQVMLEMGPQEESLHLYSVVARVPDGEEGPVLKTLLEGQLFGREIGAGITFGLDQVTGEILLWSALRERELEPDAFSAALTEFVNWTEHWHRKLNHSTPLEEDADWQAPEPTETMMRV
ncbi:Tir chaperone family protein CesT [Prosthecobacter fusiformis]|uniref:Tir chaperone family protein CesT n=1 Tax=Prosthecobacter fusiformis TaxID=48464 RepID=A0A4R7S0N6_9BACT|nr:type III secretion system chaperone [Prosthecobacter fusiformis]TDU70725.1 Tir chaperone family protein CesT [Prosthecobacter fusiformis]